jgi:hypothetical protein
VEKSDLVSSWFYRSEHKNTGVFYVGLQGDKRHVVTGKPNLQTCDTFYLDYFLSFRVIPNANI